MSRKTLALRPLVRTGAYLQADRCALEAEFLTYLILQIALIGKMQVHGMVEGDEEGGRCRAHLRSVEDRDGLSPLGGLRGVGLRGSRQDAVELPGGDALAEALPDALGGR